MKVLNTSIIIFLVFSMTLGCENNNMENRLRKRIAGVYQAWKEKNFEQLLDFGSPEIDKTENRKRKA